MSDADQDWPDDPEHRTASETWALLGILAVAALCVAGLAAGLAGQGFPG